MGTYGGEYHENERPDAVPESPQVVLQNLFLLATVQGIRGIEGHAGLKGKCLRSFT